MPVHKPKVNKNPKPGDKIYYGGQVFRVGPRGGHIPIVLKPTRRAPKKGAKR